MLIIHAYRDTVSASWIYSQRDKNMVKVKHSNVSSYIKAPCSLSSLHKKSLERERERENGGRLKGIIEGKALHRCASTPVLLCRIPHSLKGCTQHGGQQDCLHCVQECHCFCLVGPFCLFPWEVRTTFWISNAYVNLSWSHCSKFVFGSFVFRKDGHLSPSPCWFSSFFSRFAGKPLSCP